MKRFFLILALVTAVGSTFAANGGVSEAAENLFAEGICNEAYANDSSQITVYVEGSRLYTSGVADGSVLSLYSITGQRIGTYVVIDNYVDLGDALPKGIYIVRVNNHAAKITVRG